MHATGSSKLFYPLRCGQMVKNGNEKAFERQKIKKAVKGR
ncbi:hypothetical protein Cabys_2255 [Caldithrix abyssi DSM 13497]|uniref:Uncharacterized protein n=1 Tax=Caldithrix abyssi DSM 13497 TaxID=880073 RepID=A0A1J1C9C6_CALAY|nr:hypothetical protein Cabys_2255 [Caldithrix abyssi DSM 13497]